MHPNHHQFEAFAYVVREGSFSAAAARLGVTQSTITQHIAKLEKTVGTLLLLRGRDGVEFTPTGQEFYDLADRMVALDAEVSERLEGYNAMREGRLKIIGNAPQPALKIIARFRQHFPDIRVDFGLHDWTTATTMIRNRLADVGLITDAPEHDAWDRIHIEQAQYVLYCPADHWLAQQGEVSLSDLQQETLIVPEKGSLTQRLLSQTCKSHGIALTRTVTMTTFPLMCEAVLQGIGVALFLRNSSLIQDNIAQVAIREMPDAQDTYLIATKDRTRLKLVAEFINAAVA
ncbi:LysR family transcriptional regulator [uncultured Ruegeria sp.]|uniref:LysR family transcriptional regulator n=1 Tax=uncultured Ruegeria sp. TaxID=259304 RepID=UPI00262A4AA0|nr:LysR family transcriptional regulator [uncultured Ruegeria sp.]